MPSYTGILYCWVRQPLEPHHITIYSIGWIFLNVGVIKQVLASFCKYNLVTRQFVTIWQTRLLMSVSNSVPKMPLRQACAHSASSSSTHWHFKLVQFECAYDISPLYIATLKFSKIVNDYPELTLLYLIVNINAS